MVFHEKLQYYLEKLSVINPKSYEYVLLRKDALARYKNLTVVWDGADHFQKWLICNIWKALKGFRNITNESNLMPVISRSLKLIKVSNRLCDKLLVNVEPLFVNYNVASRHLPFLLKNFEMGIHTSANSIQSQL